MILESRAPVSNLPRRGVLAMAMLMTLAAALAVPTAAAGSLYVWTLNADGEWTNPANWQHVANSGPLGPGYPTARGDAALLGDEIGSMTAPRTITIPNDVHITVGIIFFKSNFAFRIQPGGSNSRLDLDNGSEAARLMRYNTILDPDLILVPIRLLSSLDVEVTPAQNTFIVAAPIGEAGGVRSAAKRGAGVVSFMSAASGNSYTGATVVEAGPLSLGPAPGPLVLGPLVVGDGIGTPGSAVVSVLAPDVIADFANVTANADGRLSVEASDRFATLTVNDGAVRVRSSSQQVTALSVRALVMNGGVLDVATTGLLALEGDVTATSSTTGPARVRQAEGAGGALHLGAATRTFLVERGPAAGHDLEINLPIHGTGSAGVTKDGPGHLRFTGAVSSTYRGVTLVRRGRVELARDSSTIAIPGSFQIGEGNFPAVVELIGAGVPNRHNIAASASISVFPQGVLAGNSDQQIGSLAVGSGGRVEIGVGSRAIWMTESLALAGGRLTVNDGGLTIRGELAVNSTASHQAVIEGSGTIGFHGDQYLTVINGPQAIDFRFAARIGSDIASGRLTKRGAGVALFEGNNNQTAGTTVADGVLIVTGRYDASATTLAGGVLGGTGLMGAVTGSSGRLAPGLSPGRLRTGALTLSASTTVAIELNGASPGTGYDQLAVTGSVSLGNAVLALTAAATLPASASFVIVSNDGADPVTGIFAGLAEGATVTVGGRLLTLSYRGGDGNDIVLTAGNGTLMTYYLAEGATGAFFDDDVLIANPNADAAPVTLTFLLEGGRTVVDRRTVPAEARLTVHVDEVPGLESAAVSVQVTSDAQLPLVVERTMFWDGARYGGHTANAVTQAETRWVFAEGCQGFFDTFILIANANDQAVTATLTFLREGEASVVKTVPVAPFARHTVYAGDYPELAGRAFGIVVEATQPVIAERAMYFGSGAGRHWAGGHVNTGVSAPSPSWFHAEGATGGYFSTFILLSNPNDAEAHVELQFLLDTGEVITRQKTIAARERVTVNPAAEGNERLSNAAVSTVVLADVPIVSERSMYWPGETSAFGEGHNSSGVVSPGTRWGLAEGRVGGPQGTIPTSCSRTRRGRSRRWPSPTCARAGRRSSEPTRCRPPAGSTST